MYLPLLSDCSNTDTLEAAIGAVQNLTACEWQPSAQFREQVCFVCCYYLLHDLFDVCDTSSNSEVIK